MKKQKPEKNRRYIMMNADGEFFAGFMYGEFIWCTDINEAKPLDDDGHKYKMMEMMWYGKELVIEYID